MEATVNLKLGLVKARDGEFKITAAVPVASLGVSGSNTQTVENSITLTYKRVDDKDANSDAALNLPIGTLATLAANPRLRPQVDAAIAALDAKDDQACSRN